MERHRQYRCGRRFKAAVSERFVLQRPRQAARLRQHPWLTNQFGKRQVSPLRPTTLGPGAGYMRLLLSNAARNYGRLLTGQFRRPTAAPYRPAMR